MKKTGYRRFTVVILLLFYNVKLLAQSLSILANKRKYYEQSPSDKQDRQR